MNMKMYKTGDHPCPAAERKKNLDKYQTPLALTPSRKKKQQTENPHIDL
jgi:hypothetical protein